MSIDVAKLKSKGEPPKLEDAPNIIAKPPRETREGIKAIQFKIPESVYEDFCIEAVKRMGGGTGAKSDLFLRMWESYKGRR